MWLVAGPPRVAQACLAVKSVSPGSFWAFVGAVFEHQEDFSDHHTYHKSRAQARP